MGMGGVGLGGGLIGQIISAKINFVSSVLGAFGNLAKTELCKDFGGGWAGSTSKPDCGWNSPSWENCRVSVDGGFSLSGSKSFGTGSGVDILPGYGGQGGFNPMPLVVDQGCRGSDAAPPSAPAPDSGFCWKPPVDCNPQPKPPVDCNPQPKPPVDCNPQPKPPVDCGPQPKPPVDGNPRPKPPVDCYPQPKPPVDCHPRPKPPVDCYPQPKPPVDCKPQVPEGGWRHPSGTHHRGGHGSHGSFCDHGYKAHQGPHGGQNWTQGGGDKLRDYCGSGYHGGGASKPAGDLNGWAAASACLVFKFGKTCQV